VEGRVEEVILEAGSKRGKGNGGNNQALRSGMAAAGKQPCQSQ
jgi:hypothetical protein